MGDQPSISDVCQWDIWQVFWPHDDEDSKSEGKERPALAISTAAEISIQGFAEFIKITGQDHPKILRLCISSAEPTFRHTGLDYTSWVHYMDNAKLQDADLRYRRGRASAMTAAYFKMRFDRWKSGN